MKCTLKKAACLVLFTIMLLSFFCCANASAASVTASGSCGSNVFWQLDSEGMLTISGSGAMQGWSSVSSVPWYSYRNSIRSLTIEEGVVSIGANAFKNCSALQSAFVPEGISYIGGGAFGGCSSMVSVTIPDSMDEIDLFAFDGCSSLTQVNISSLEEWFNIKFHSVYSNPLCYGALLYMEGSPMTHVDVPNGVTIIGNYALSGCGLASITIPETTVEIGDSVFYGCPNLVSVAIPDSVAIIGSWLFSQCARLSSVILPEGITYIGFETFNSCSSLTEVSIPDSITSIHSYAFRGCSSLASLSLPDGITNIGKDVFRDCPNLSKVYTPTLEGWLDIDFEDYASTPLYYGAELYVDGELLTHVDIPAHYSSINNFAFYGCSSLVSVSIPDGVTSIENSAFQNCVNLVSVSIPDSVERIESEALCGCSSLVSITIPQSVKKLPGFKECSSLTSIFIPDGITDAPAYAFEGCSSLTEVYVPSLEGWLGIHFTTPTSNPMHYAKHLNINGELLTQAVIPEGITSIGSYAFYNCSMLSSVTIPEGITSIGNYAFYNCSMIPSVTIPEGITSIGNYAFYNCSMIPSVTIPESMTSIGIYAFSGCSSLTEVHTPTLAGWLGIDFEGSYSNPMFCAKELYISGSPLRQAVIPDGISSIGYSAFYGCSSLVSVTIPDSVTSIDAYAFSGCSSLVSASIPDSVTYIGGYAFSDCSVLSSVTIPEKTTYLGEYAFSNCSGLSSISIPSSVTIIGKGVFSGCTNLVSASIPGRVISGGGPGNFSGTFNYTFGSDNNVKEVTIAEGTASIGNYAFSGSSSIVSISIPDSVVSIGTKAFNKCSSLLSISLPEGVSSIPQWAFYDCSSLTSVSIPSSVHSIDTYAFYGCSSLTSVSIPSGVSSIASSVFYGCSSLSFVSIPESVTSIGANAFRDCSSLTSISIPGSVASIDNSAFSGCSGLTSVSVPGCVISGGRSSNFPGTFIYYFGSSNKVEEITIADGVSSIGQYAFAGCFKLTSISIPDSVTSVGDCAFLSCSRLTQVHIPTLEGWLGIRFASSTSTPTYYSGELYIGSELLTHAVIPEDTASIGDYAFYNCSSLASISIPSTVSTIGQSAFHGCNRLQSMTFQGDLPYVTASQFSSEENSLKQVAVLGDSISGNVQSPFPSGTVITCYRNTAVDSWAQNQGYDICYLSDQNELQSVTLPESARLLAGTTLNVYAEVFPLYPNVEITWSSSAPQIASVEDGCISAISPGEAVITASCGGISGSMTVTVDSPVLSFDLSAQELYITSGQTVQLSIQNVQPADSTVSYTWTIDNSDIASIDENGLVTGISLGDAVVTVNADGGVSRSCLIHVRSPITAFTVSPDKADLKIYHFQALTVAAEPAIQDPANCLFTFASSNPAVASVDENGIIFGISAGSAVITVTSFNGITVVCPVTVAADDIFILPDHLITIEAEAFMNTKMDVVILPDGCENIGSCAFANAVDLSIYIPDSVTNIADDAFSGCANLCFVCESENTAAEYAAANGICYRTVKTE